MRIALCQINTVAGDIPENVRRIAAAATDARRQNARLALFPELTICGYPPRDLLDRRAFVDENLRAIEALAGELPADLAVLVGFVDRTDEKRSGVLYNAAALVLGGRIAQRFHKRLLPAYDVFDERRYFRPGELPLTFDLDGQRIGLLICEDAWNATDSPLRQEYTHDPVAACIEEGADVLANLSASPFTLSKRAARQDMFAAIAREQARPLLLANLVGATDDLIFDGSSAVFGPTGNLWARAQRFSEHVLVCELLPEQAIAPQAETDAGAALDGLVLGVRDYARKCGFRQAVLGLSGGVDSSLVAAVAAEALGPDKVLGIAMPTRYSSEGSLADAATLAQGLGIEHRVIDIDSTFQSFLDTLTPTLEALGPAPAVDTTFENIQARIRGVTLMAVSNRLGHLLLTTGNKSEIAVGYCTLYGDMAGGLAVISDLPKTFVYDVCREYNGRAGRDVIPKTVLTKPPSAELRPDQTDQDSLPPYDVLDAILARLVEGEESQTEVIAAGFEPELVARIAHLVRINEYKRRQMPPGLIVTSKAFGPGRRYPIAHGYQG